MSHPHQGLPATPREIRLALVALELVSRKLVGEGELAEVDAGTGQMIHGLVLGLEGTVFPLPDDPQADIGYRVGQSLVKGGSPWV